MTKRQAAVRKALVEKLIGKLLKSQRRTLTTWLEKRLAVQRKRRGPRPPGETYCIVCRERIPLDRERKGQHTCGDECQHRYKIFRRRQLAEVKCRECGHGLSGEERALRLLQKKRRAVGAVPPAEGVSDVQPAAEVVRRA